MTSAPKDLTGITLCSGIGAPEMAAPWIDWRLASEIEPFPRAVLQKRFGYKMPKDQNQGEALLWGDMTEVCPDLLRDHGLPLPDLIVAGTPCQAFSVAGARRGMKDARGNLTLKFVETCHDIASARHDGRLAVLWENVPGVLSDRENAFGCFLGGLVGADDALDTPDAGSWPSVGMVEGPRARAAWRVLDAQYFGVAQRRRRVFLVVDFGGAIDPAAVLFERKSLRGNSPPRREKGEKPAPTISARPSGGGGLGTDFDLDGGLIASTGEISHCLNAGGMGRQDFETETETETVIAHALRGEGFDASEDGTGRGTPIAPIPFNTTQITSAENGSNPQPDDPCHTLAAKDHAPAIAIQERATSDNPDAEPDGVGVRDDDKAYTLEARQTPQAVAFDMRGRDGGAMPEGPHDTANIRAASGGSSRSYVAEPWTVRRLTPLECARLQGFPDDHTAIDYRGKPAADGPQYKALGNSMAVPCIKWIIDRMAVSMKAARKHLAE